MKRKRITGSDEEEDRKMLGGLSSRRWSARGLRATARTEKEKSSGFWKKPKTKRKLGFVTWKKDT